MASRCRRGSLLCGAHKANETIQSGNRVRWFGCVVSVGFRGRFCFREQLNLGYLGGCNESKFSSFIRVALAANMQNLKELLADCWAFSVALDSAMVETLSLFHICARFVVRGIYYTFTCFPYLRSVDTQVRTCTTCLRR